LENILAPNSLPYPLFINSKNKIRFTLVLVFLIISTAVFTADVFGQVGEPLKQGEKMKIEVWSDVVCPFCYIGKKKFETALAEFEKRNNVEFVWKSFQLNPNVKTNLDISLYEHLAESKGISVEQAKGMGGHAAQVANAVGLTMNFDKSVVANSFNAHRLIHFAKANGLQHEMKERLFKAYFTEGKNIDDTETLITLATEIGLNAEEVKAVLESNKYADAVQFDVQESQQLGVQGVPFFVFDRKYAVSGAQDSSAFLETLKKSFAEWRKANPTVKLQVSEGPVCTPDKVCE
jgi:predicted DsbA family dithiol-disulfide isomerase